jgi:hypothetical protein
MALQDDIKQAEAELKAASQQPGYGIAALQVSVGVDQLRNRWRRTPQQSHSKRCMLHSCMGRATLTLECSCSLPAKACCGKSL